MVTPRHIDLEGNWLRTVQKCLQTLGVLAPYWLNVSTYGCWGLLMRWHIAFLGAGFSGTLVGYPGIPSSASPWTPRFSQAVGLRRWTRIAARRGGAVFFFLNPTLWCIPHKKCVHVETQYMTLYNYIEINIHAHTCITMTWHDMTLHDITYVL